MTVIERCDLAWKAFKTLLFKCLGRAGAFEYLRTCVRTLEVEARLEAEGVESPSGPITIDGDYRVRPTRRVQLVES